MASRYFRHQVAPITIHVLDLEKQKRLPPIFVSMSGAQLYIEASDAWNESGAVDDKYFIYQPDTFAHRIVDLSRQTILQPVFRFAALADVYVSRAIAWDKSRDESTRYFVHQVEEDVFHVYDFKDNKLLPGVFASDELALDYVIALNDWDRS